MRCFKALIFVTLMLIACPVFAAGPQGVQWGVHNLSASGVDQFVQTPGSSLYRTNVEQVCVFCHTPHGGSLNAPLWNRDPATGGGSWSHYNSAVLKTDLSLSLSRTPSNETMLCLSCHDGSISVNHLINPPNSVETVTTWSGDTGTEIIDDIITGQPAKRIGGSPTTPGGSGDLSDDHPISFSYSDVYNSATYQAGGARAGELKTIGAAAGAGVKFFGATNRVECSSCHDPHVNYIATLGSPPGDPAYAPFLITSNAGSALCLACHTK